MTEQEREEWGYVAYWMNNEGFHYCFKQYSNFSEIKDEKFHELREQYIEISNSLEKYITDKNNIYEEGE